MKFVTNLTFTICIIVSVYFPQTHFTLPQNVWRISVSQSYSTGNWIGKPGQKGIINQEYVLDGYGKRYFDHGYVDESGNFISPDDLYDLDAIFLNSTTTAGEAIDHFNRDIAPLFEMDTLLNYKVDFFGPDSIRIGGSLTETRDRIISATTYKVEYGFSNRLTMVLSIPFINRYEVNRNWSWNPYETDGLKAWLDYHQEARQRLDSLQLNVLYGSIDKETRSNLESVYERFYTWNGNNSVLWAMKGGEDPVGSAIVGSQYNPLAEDDTTGVTIYELLNYYLPPKRTSTGLGDVSLGINILLAGTPAWKASGSYSLYGGLHVTLPSGKALGPFLSNDTDIDSRPQQFNELPIGAGVSKWRISFFGEFYRVMKSRLFNFNWFTELGISSREYLNTPISFLATSSTNQDSIISLLGDKYFYQPGNEFQVAAAAKLELWPKRISAGMFLKGQITGPDDFSSNDSQWNRWMRKHNGYDTRSLQVTPAIVLYFHNVNPLIKLGPIPFEIEFGIRASLITSHNYSNLEGWVGFSSYWQAW